MLRYCCGIRSLECFPSDRDIERRRKRPALDLHGNRDQWPVGLVGVTEVLRSVLAPVLLDAALLPALPVPGGMFDGVPLP
jgi:hypothetical protein